MSAPPGIIGGKRINALVERIIARYDTLVELFVEAMMVDGFPPGSQPLSPLQQYQQLTAWQAAGDPRYWNNPAAQASLAKLATRFGAPPQLANGPFGVAVPNQPQQQLASSLAAQKLGPYSDLGAGLTQ